ncbi:WGR and DUF4132 domain-containing protein [Duganella sp. Root198D2]|uniref:WGR and DUF4132 domain-containing protein n=1 Tax=Duganella sp. Root198D2 TaxID=1736489 RepID=UPI00070AC97D|nr:DUF4132 domain-containing protein [Duganella sp. Root198D2]KRB97051.1 hypothetical protein ASE26_03160 [Duganella sp. Root198D2]
MRRFEFSDSSSNKFWEIEQGGLDLNLRWGRIGTQGQSQTKSFADDAKCGAAMAKLIAEKTGKGYVEIDITPASIGKAAPKPLAEPKPEAPDAAVAVPAPAAAAAPVAAADPSTTPPWLVHWVPVALPRKLAAAALPSRRFPKPVPAVDATDVFRRIFECQLPDAEATYAELRPAFEEAWERLRTRTLDGSVLSDAVLLAMAAKLPWDWEGKNDVLAEHMVHALAKHKGLEHCVDAFIEMQRIQMHWTNAGNLKRKVSARSVITTELGVSEPLTPVEVAMRRQLSSAPEAVWQVCADKIEHAIPTVHIMRKAGLAAQLPERPEISDRLAPELAKGQAAHTLPLLLMTASDPGLAEKFDIKISDHERWCRNPMLAATVVQERGADAFAILKLMPYSEPGCEAMSYVGTPEAIKLLAEVLAVVSDTNTWTAISLKMARTNFSAALAHAPLAGIAALAELGERRGKEGEVLQTSLTTLLRIHADQVPQLMAWLSPAAQALLQRQLEKLGTSMPVAAREDLPGVLADPPWLRPRKKPAAALVVPPLPLAPVERWDGIDREEWLAAHSQMWGRFRKEPSNPVSLAWELGFYGDASDQLTIRALAVKAIENNDTNGLAEAWRLYQEAYPGRQVCAVVLALLPEAMRAEAWNKLEREVDPYHPRVAGLLAKLGLPALPGFEAMVARRTNDVGALAKCFGSTGLALPMARAAAKLKKIKEDARQWLLRFPAHAICGLLAPALGKAGEDRDCAASALRYLGANGHEALIFEMAARYEDAAIAKALRALLDEDPLERLPAKLPKLPDFWAPLGWRRPVLNDSCGAGAGKAVPDSALDHIGTMLMFPTVDGLYPGIAQVKDACTAESLADFAWDCFSSWLNAGGNSKEGWAMTAMGWLGTDDTARKLTPFIRTWPGESAHARAVSALDVLADIGTDTALMLLNGIAQKVKFKGLQDKAREKIDKIAEARELTTEELEDRLAPDLGLDDNGSVLLDFGPRQFRVGFDEALKPYVRDSEGKRLADLPKPKQSDDEALAGAAVDRYKLLKKDARTIASQQVVRLEWAMCSQRRWLPEHFRMFLAGHPLVRHLVQRLVWGAYEVADGENAGGRLLACFRVAEDGSWTTGEDDRFTMPEGANIRVGLPHALELAAEVAAQFGQLFADYELLQPFSQLGRDTYALGADEQAVTVLERWKGAVVPTGRVLGLVNKGWRRGQAQDGGGIWFFHKPLNQTRVIELRLDPGIIVGMVDEYPEQTLQTISVGSPSSWGEIKAAESLAILDPIATSELIRDIESLRA